MQNSGFPGVPRPAELIAYLFFEPFVFLVTQERVSHPGAAWPRLVAHERQIPLLPGFLDIHLHSRYFNRRHAVDVIVAREELVVNDKGLRIAPGRREVAKLVVERPTLIDFFLGEIRAQVPEFIELPGRVLRGIDAEYIGVAGHTVVGDHGFPELATTHFIFRSWHIPQRHEFVIWGSDLSLFRLVGVVLPLDTRTCTRDLSHDRKDSDRASIPFLDVRPHVARHHGRCAHALILYNHGNIRGLFFAVLPGRAITPSAHDVATSTTFQQSATSSAGATSNVRVVFSGCTWCTATLKCASPVSFHARWSEKTMGWRER